MAQNLVCYNEWKTIGMQQGLLFSAYEPMLEVDLIDQAFCKSTRKYFWKQTFYQSINLKNFISQKSSTQYITLVN